MIYPLLICMWGWWRKYYATKTWINSSSVGGDFNSQEYLPGIPGRQLIAPKTLATVYDWTFLHRTPVTFTVYSIKATLHEQHFSTLTVFCSVIVNSRCWPFCPERDEIVLWSSTVILQKAIVCLNLCFCLVFFRRYSVYRTNLTTWPLLVVKPLVNLQRRKERFVQPAKSHTLCVNLMPTDQKHRSRAISRIQAHFSCLTLGYLDY